MTAVLVMTCPHCSAENMTFNVKADCSHPGKRARTALALCAQCQMPVEAMFEWESQSRSSPPHDWKLVNYDGNLLDATYIKRIGIWPKPLRIDAPQNVPDRVAKAYIEAAKARRAQLWNAACGAYRRCMELALKDLSPEIEAWKIEKRIDKMAAQHLITPEIQAWAHDLRLDGNDAVHGDEEATQEVTDQMHNLTFFLLTYLFTLPKQITDARTRRDGTTLTAAPAT